VDSLSNHCFPLHHLGLNDRAPFMFSGSRRPVGLTVDMLSMVKNADENADVLHGFFGLALQQRIAGNRTTYSTPGSASRKSSMPGCAKPSEAEAGFHSVGKLSLRRQSQPVFKAGAIFWKLHTYLEDKLSSTRGSR
jgi:hypothetical protein